MEVPITMHNLTEEDVGKTVVNRAGDEIGRVSSVEGGSAFVDPDPGLTDTIKAKLGWDEPDKEDYRLDESQIHTVTDDEIRLG